MNDFDPLQIRYDIFDAVEKNLEDRVFFQLQLNPDHSKQFNYLSDNMSKYSSSNLDDIKKNPAILYDKVLPEYANELHHIQEFSAKNLTLFNAEFPLMTPGNQIRWISLKSVPKRLADGAIIWNGIQQDITDRKSTERRIAKQNHILKLLTTINDITLHARDSDELLEAVSQTIVDRGGYKLIWFCTIPSLEETTALVEPFLSYGNTDYLNEIKIDLKDPTTNNGPTAKALLHNSITVTNNMSQADYFTPWLAKATKYELRSSLVIPFTFNGKRSALNLYSNESNAFDVEEVELLNRIMQIISNALQKISIEKEKQYNTHQLNERIKELKTIFDINTILTSTENSLDNVLQQITNRIPAGWQYPEACEARIVFDNKEYKTMGHKDSEYKLRQSFVTENHLTGFVEVVYVNNQFFIGIENPFLPEESNLMVAIIKLFTLYYQRHISISNLIRSEANLKTIFNNSHIQLALLKTNTEVLAINEAFKIQYRMIAGCDINTGDSFVQFLTPKRQDFINDLILKIVNKEIPFGEYEYDYVFETQEHNLSLIYLPVLIENKVNAIVVLSQDITHRKQVEKEKEKLINDLLVRNTELEQFAFIISHNLRAPVANIIGLNNLLQSPLEDIERKEISELIDKSVGRLDEVINDLNDILTIRREVNEIKSAVNIKGIIKQVIHSISSLVNESGAHFELNIKDDLEIKTIRSFIMSTFLNLITNSIKYAREEIKPVIKIDTKIDNGKLIIQYADNGLGLDLERYGKSVFGMYQRFHLHKEGKGIGLYLVKTQVEILNGNISVEGTPNNGLTFLITLPI